MPSPEQIQAVEEEFTQATAELSEAYLRHNAAVLARIALRTLIKKEEQNG